MDDSRFVHCPSETLEIKKNIIRLDKKKKFATIYLLLKKRINSSFLYTFKYAPITPISKPLYIR